MSDTLHLAQQLISCPSVTPADSGCQKIIAARLQSSGFAIHHLPFGEVENLWAQRQGYATRPAHNLPSATPPLFVFAGHTDVVPSGPTTAWRSDPFVPTLRDGCLFGRGAADMKGSLAAMVVATERFVQAHPQHAGSIGFLLTSDEEGPATDGTIKVMQWLQHHNVHIDYCLVGEPSSTRTVGDVIKIGRRGSLSGQLTIHGTQGHVAYPHLADNPIHRAVPALTALCQHTWDRGNAFFPATSFQIVSMRAGENASNIIPGQLDVLFNFRFSTEHTATSLQQLTESMLQQHQLRYSITWSLSGQPFITHTDGALIHATQEAIHAITGQSTELSTSGGTSDGRFIAPTGAQVVELGPINATIHKIDEHVNIADLETLTQIYQRVLETLLAANA